jgi:nucleoside-diphosphate-sugar epimerase
VCVDNFFTGAGFLGSHLCERLLEHGGAFKWLRFDSISKKKLSAALSRQARCNFRHLS